MLDVERSARWSGKTSNALLEEIAVAWAMEPGGYSPRCRLIGRIQDLPL
jgi:hypothetical protein